MIYIQAILYLIREYWKAIVTVTPLIITAIFAFAFLHTNNNVYRYSGLVTAILALIVALIVYAPKIGKTVDKLVPKDEER